MLRAKTLGCNTPSMSEQPMKAKPLQSLEPFQTGLDFLKRQAEARLRLNLTVAEQTKIKARDEHKANVELMTANAYVWATRHTKTYNEHWKEEGRPSPEEPFPDDPYFAYVFACMKLNPVWWWEKSRDMMLSWACVAFLELEAMKNLELFPMTHTLPTSSRA
jgi:hypothetical protein